jgi:hypothetical protein
MTILKKLQYIELETVSFPELFRLSDYLLKKRQSQSFRLELVPPANSPFWQLQNSESVWFDADDS